MLFRSGTDQGRLQFEPSELTIKPGDTVKWVANKFMPHNVVFDKTTVPDTFVLKENHKRMLFTAGESFQTTFNEPGVYRYYCEAHRGAGEMGKITVTE